MGRGAPMADTGGVMGRSRWARPLAAGALAVVVAAGLGACVTSGYTYITNTSTKTYFKVPQQWKLFNQNQILQGESGLISPQQAQTSRQQQWVVAFDGDPRPAISHVLAEHSRYPMGFARVRALTAADRDT